MRMAMENYWKPCGCEGMVVSDDPFIYDESLCEGHTTAADKAIALKIALEELGLLRLKLARAVAVVEKARAANNCGHYSEYCMHYVQLCDALAEFDKGE